MRFLASFFLVRGQRADGPCDGRCVENKRQIKVDRTPQKRSQHTHESRGVVGARGGHGAGAWVADMACWETHGDVRAPPAPTRSCGHGMVGWDMEMDSQVDMRVMRAPAGRIHRPRDSRKRAVISTLFRRRYHPPRRRPRRYRFVKQASSGGGSGQDSDDQRLLLLPRGDPHTHVLA